DLELVDGEKQTVPDADIPEDNTITLNFKTWATENVGANTVYQNLILSNEGMKTLDGETTIYKVTGCEADGDFSEFAETFAIANTQNKVRMRGSVGLQLTSGNVTTFSILNLNPGDGVTITFGSGSSGVTTLTTLSENIFLSTDETQTVLDKGTALTSKTVTYVVKSGTQIDLTFGSTGGHFINSIVIEPGLVEIKGDEPTPTLPVTIHTIGDSTMSHYDQSIDAQKGMDGWGDYLADCMNGELVTVKNWADRGETAKSYYNGYWNGTKPDERPDFTQEISKEVSEGDYVIIQFGHNDSKAYDTATYEEWLGTLVDAVKAKGATPIMAGSICRARFGSDGKITRLGRIDTGEENGVPEDDHSFDYPYHAQQVAQAKGIEFIDVTSGVKEMFETYGEAKTKALFPSGEKTHTNKLGAQLIAKVAARLLLDTELKNYVDETTLELPDAEDIDVIIDDFGSEATVTKKTVWTFNDVEAGTAVSDENNEIVNRNGLYVRGRAGARAINAVASALTSVSFSDDTEQRVSVMAQTAGANTATESTIG
ncbi:MAG: GDSL-type esterase/lipase family protein, partial [Prevotellaceae bacterium]|nr:GDSL-type esterase/lipase family protein [Prevotellaceae bacterium]